MKIRENIFNISVLVAFVIFVSSFGLALANGWWGEGYKSSKWILKNGGTIVRYEIDNISGDEDEYKVVLYDEDGDYVEVEYGVEGLMDDAKDGIYKVKADRGVESEETYRGGKSFATIEFRAHPGETIWLKFDYKKKKVKMATDYVRPAPKVVAKAIPAAEPVEAEPEPEKIDEAVVPETEEDEGLIPEAVEDMILPEAEAMESETGAIHEKDADRENVFAKIWKAIKNLFNI